MNTPLEFKHKEVKSFFKSSLETYEQAILEVAENFAKKIEGWENLNFKKFDSVNTYNGELKNTIFVYHHDHYRGNSSTACSAENLIHPNNNMDDRGYIKGIALDLTNYLVLRNLHGGFSFSHEFFYLYGTYSKNQRPSFKKSKHYNSKMVELAKIDKYFEEKKNELLADYRKKEDEFLKELTGLSINHYSIKF